MFLRENWQFGEYQSASIQKFWYQYQFFLKMPIHQTWKKTDHIVKTFRESERLLHSGALTLLFESYDLGIGAKAVPRSAVVDGLEVSGDDVTHGQRGDDAFLCAHRLHGVAPGRPGLQHSLLPGPGLRVGDVQTQKYGRNTYRHRDTMSPIHKHKIDPPCSTMATPAIVYINLIHTAAK